MRQHAGGFNCRRPHIHKSHGIVRLWPTRSRQLSAGMIVQPGAWRWAGDGEAIMRCRLATGNIRRVLCVFPAYAPAFGTFSHALRLVGARAFMPPQGLLLIANYLPKHWPVRFIDENMD